MFSQILNNISKLAVGHLLRLMADGGYAEASQGMAGWLDELADPGAEAHARAGWRVRQGRVSGLPADLALCSKLCFGKAQLVRKTTYPDHPKS